MGKAVTLVAAAGGCACESEFFADATDDMSQAIEWTMPAGRFVDASPLLLLTTASLAGRGQAPPGRRLGRAAVPAEPADRCRRRGLDRGRMVRPHRARLRARSSSSPRLPCVRCTMVTRPQPDLDRDLDIYKAVARHHDGNLGVWTQVHAAGSVAVDDLVTVGS